MTVYAKWVEENWTRFVGSGRWLLGNGPNWVQPAEWDARPYRVLIARLSPWQDVLQSSTHRLLYAILRKQPCLFPDMAFIPPLRDTKTFRNANVPWWLSVGTHRHPKDFDCIAISNALVQEFINLAPALEASGIPISKQVRMADSSIPLLILGGANSLHSSLLWNEDPLVDAIFVGEDPEWIETIFTLCAEAKRKKQSKAQTLKTLVAQVPGFFLPEAIALGKTTVEKVHASVPSINQHKVFEPMMPAEEIAGVSALHISEGCPSFCSFCAESYARKPYREVPQGLAVEQALEMKTALGLEEIELFSFNFNNYEAIHTLIPDLLTRFGRVGLKSQRFDALAEDPALVKLMRVANKSSLTCGLEGISNRVRSYMQKGLDEVQLRRALEAMLKEPLRELKIFLIATGLEQAEDFEEFKGFMQWFRHLYDRTQRRPRVTFSATPLVRFPWTPLEYEDAPTAEQCGRHVRAIKDCVARSGFEFREAASVWESEVSQILVRARDVRVLQACISAQQRTGFLYAEAVDDAFGLALREELAKLGIDVYQALRGHDYAAEVPWRFVSPGISRGFLEKIHQQSVQALQAEICLGSFDKMGKCLVCDACTPAERKAITHKRTKLNQAQNVPIRVELEVQIPVRLSERCARWPLKMLSAWLVHGLCTVIPEFANEFIRHSKWDMERKLDVEYCLVTGDTEIPLMVSQAGQDLVAAFIRDSTLLQKLNGELHPWIECLGNVTPMKTEFVFTRRGFFSPSAWLVSKGLKHTLRKEATRQVFEFSKDALKKRMIQSMWIESVDGIQRMTLTPLEKFPLIEFVQNSAVFEHADEWRKIELTSFYKRF